MRRIFAFLPNVIDEPRPGDYCDLSSCNRIVEVTTILRKTDRSGRWLWRLVRRLGKHRDQLDSRNENLPWNATDTFFFAAAARSNSTPTWRSNTIERTPFLETAANSCRHIATKRSLSLSSEVSDERYSTSGRTERPRHALGCVSTPLAKVHLSSRLESRTS